MVLKKMGKNTYKRELKKEKRNVTWQRRHQVPSFV